MEILTEHVDLTYVLVLKKILTKLEMHKILSSSITKIVQLPELDFHKQVLDQTIIKLVVLISDQVEAFYYQ